MSGNSPESENSDVQNIGELTDIDVEEIDPEGVATLSLVGEDGEVAVDVTEESLSKLTNGAEDALSMMDTAVDTVTDLI